LFVTGFLEDIFTCGVSVFCEFCASHNSFIEIVIRDNCWFVVDVTYSPSDHAEILVRVKVKLGCD